MLTVIRTCPIDDSGRNFVVWTEILRRRPGAVTFSTLSTVGLILYQISHIFNTAVMIAFLSDNEFYEVALKDP